jgi:D-alanine--poly(phosphoribitol) ligase subunit 1
VSNGPEASALHYTERRISFSELQDWANRLAQFLLDKGCQRGDVVAIGHTKKPLSYALMLAGLKLGIPYVNIDVASPIERNSRILRMSKPRLLFCDDNQYQESSLVLADKCGCQLCNLDERSVPSVSTQQLDEQERLMDLVDSSCIAYIMFTSGSTGDPKGVAVTHQNVLNFIDWGQKRFNVVQQTNFTNLSPMYFDNSVFDFYVGLFSCASLTPIPRPMLTAPYDLVQYVESMRCTVWFSVPSLLMYLMTMKAMKAAMMPSLRQIVFGGEGYPKTELKKLYDEFCKQATLVNVYGPTECTCICSAHTLAPEDFMDLEGLPTLGELNPNFDYRILDEEGRDCLEGELSLIGPNVAAGYFNDLDRTAASFSTIMEPNRFMKRMYRTGDLVRERDGRLYFAGRKDNQIKHMGYRIELEEIENALVSLPQIDQAAVIYHRTFTTHGKIIAFVASSEEDLDETLLFKSLANLLPDYMIPSKITVNLALPKNANGKVDRHRLKSLIDSS